MRKGKGPKAEPCGIPVNICLVVEISFSITINCFLPFRYDMNQSFATPLTQFFNEYIMINCIKNFFGFNKDTCNIFAII